MGYIKVTSQDVKDFWKYMSKKYDFEIVQKQDDDAMNMIGLALDMMNIQSQKQFLNSFTTTVVFGGWRGVYIPFEIGNDNGAGQDGLISQICICVHEAQHVVQADREIGQPMKYILSDSSRAFYEADAYRATMEMHYFFTGRVLSPRELAGSLKNYSVGKADRRIAEKHLRIAAEVVKRGGVITGASKTAIRWWKNKKKSIPFRKAVYFKV